MRGTLARLAMLAVITGCASAPVDRPHGPSPGIYRAIAIVPVSGVPKSDFAGISSTDPQDYAKAGMKGLGWGAVSGVAAGALLPFALAAGPAGIVAIPFLFAGAAAIGFVGGYAHDASAIGPSRQTAALQATMTSAVIGAALPSAMADAIAGGIARWTPYRAQTFASGTATSEIAAHRFGAEGFDGVLQVEITRFGYAARNVGKDIALFMTAEARLVDVMTGQPVALRGLAYMSPWHDADLWTKNNGALTRTELARASRSLAERIVEDLFLRTPRLALGDESLRANVCGVLPIAMPDAAMYAGPGIQPPVKVDSVTPRLAWAERPAAASTLAAGPPASMPAEDLRYDLRVFEEFDWGPGDLVYERDGLAGSGHRVESELKAATMYFWTIRVRYAVDGEPRATRWSATADPATLDPLPPQVVFSSQPAQDAATPVRCVLPQDFTPCGCLDYIPTANWFRFRTP